MKTLLYYGVENVTEKATSFENTPIPEYRKGVWSYQLLETENETEVREKIEKRCRSNPDFPFLSHIIQGGIEIVHFRWLS